MTAEQRRELIRRIVDQAPPFTDEQRQRIQTLLRAPATEAVEGRAAA